ncbi:MAG: ribonuclease H-like domain-containing protein [Leptospiraceae bacterium]|nr:ribonuclease H-like domain-containing protein [Leptospiraceae bacterium]
MMDLATRIRAYRQTKHSEKPIAQVAITPAKPFESQEQVHPCGLSLELPEKLACDFRCDFSREELLFLDLETTGLGSAEQVYPFLIGTAFWQDGLIMRQYFAETPAEEKDILAATLSAIRQRVLVTFNGKSFDLPLLARRAEKYGLPFEKHSTQHVDLYHTIRRIFPEKPARLSDAETRLLGFERKDDLSGAAVAQAYFEYVRFGAEERRQAILEHNRLDVLALAALLLRVSQAFCDARSGKMAWAYKIHRDKSAGLKERKLLLEQIPALKRDARDWFLLGEIHHKEKNLRRATLCYLRSYRYGFANALVRAVRCLSALRRFHLQSLLARYGLRREQASVQKQLLRYSHDAPLFNPVAESADHRQKDPVPKAARSDQNRGIA